jgi:hypothetical protein
MRGKRGQLAGAARLPCRRCWRREIPCPGRDSIGEAVVDFRRKIFASTVRELFSFLVEVYGFSEPTFTDGGGPNSYLDLDATYSNAGFTVHIRAYTWYGGENSVEVHLTRTERGGPNSVESRVDNLAYNSGLARAASIPTGARTGFEMRRALTAQAAMTRRLLQRMAHEAT